LARTGHDSADLWMSRALNDTTIKQRRMSLQFNVPKCAENAPNESTPKYKKNSLRQICFFFDLPQQSFLGPPLRKYRGRCFVLSHVTKGVLAQGGRGVSFLIVFASYLIFFSISLSVGFLNGNFLSPLMPTEGFFARPAPASAHRKSVLKL